MRFDCAHCAWKACAVAGACAALVACGARSDLVAETGRVGEGGASGASSATSSGSASTASTSSGMGGPDPDLMLTIGSSTSGFVGLFCTPGPAGDPVATNFAMMLYNLSQTTKDVSFAGTSFVLTKGNRTLTWTFTLEPTDSGPLAPGSNVLQAYNLAHSGSGKGDGVPCDYCDSDAVLDLAVSEPGWGSWVWRVSTTATCNP